MKQNFTLITLGATNFERAVKFYEKGLGWKKSKASMDDIAFFQLSGIILSIYPKKMLAKDATISGKGTGFGGITLSHNTSSEKEVEEILKKVVKHGAKIVKPAQKVFWGGYSGYFKDTEGHLIEVAYNPFWKLDKKGIVKLKK